MLAIIGSGLAASLFVVSCGGSKATGPTSPPRAVGTAPNLVTQNDVRRATPGSPQRAVLEWAQAIQFTDPRTVIASYTPAAVKQASAGAIRHAVFEIGAGLGRPEVVGVTSLGARRVRVRGFLISYDPRRRPALRQPVTFDLVRAGGHWLLSDPALLLRTGRDEAAVRSGQG